MTNRPDEPSNSGLLFGSETHREQIENVMRLADVVYTDATNASVHAKFLLEMLKDLRS